MHDDSVGNPKALSPMTTSLIALSTGVVDRFEILSTSRVAACQLRGFILWRIVKKEVLNGMPLCSIILPDRSDQSRSTGLCLNGVSKL